MGKTAFMFPGQGTQIAGMGKDFYDAYPESREVYETASEVTNMSIEELCFTENAKLNITEYTQIALFTTEMAILSAVKKEGFCSDVNIGLSLGEYAALTESGVCSLEDACRLVRKRGIYMEHEVPAGEGTMAAVLGLSAQEVSACMEKLQSQKRQVYAANYNCPGQVVISGKKQDVLDSFEALKQAGAKKVLELNVSGPFHSKLLKRAGEKLAEQLAISQIKSPVKPYIANVNAEYVTSSTTGEEIRRMLIHQVSSPVMFEQSIRRLLSDGVDTFIEIGPGKTLTGFVKKIMKSMADMEEKNIQLINISKVENICVQ